MNLIKAIFEKMSQSSKADVFYIEAPENSKFPHYIIMTFKKKPNIIMLMDINDWLRNSYGPIGERWGMYHYNKDLEHLYEFRFAEQKDAMHFKLVWG